MGRNDKEEPIFPLITIIVPFIIPALLMAYKWAVTDPSSARRGAAFYFGSFLVNAITGLVFVVMKRTENVSAVTNALILLAMVLGGISSAFIVTGQLESAWTASIVAAGPFQMFGLVGVTIFVIALSAAGGSDDTGSLTNLTYGWLAVILIALIAGFFSRRAASDKQSISFIACICCWSAVVMFLGFLIIGGIILLSTPWWSPAAMAILAIVVAAVTIGLTVAGFFRQKRRLKNEMDEETVLV